MSDEERFIDAVEKLEALNRNFHMDKSEYYNDDNTPNYSVLAEAAEAQLSEAQREIQNALDTNTEAPTTYNGDAGNTDDVPDAGDLEIVPAEIDVTDIPASSDAGDEPVHIFADYYGNSILYDEAKTQEALTAIDNYAQSFKDTFDTVRSYDAFFDNLEYPYNKLIPSPRVEDILNQVNSELDTERDNIKQKIDEIIQAILAYSKGDATAIAALFVGNGGGGDPSPSPAPTFDGDDDLIDDIDNLDDGITDNNNQSDSSPSFDEDEKFIIPSTGSLASGGSSSGGYSAGTSNVEDDKDTTLDEVSSSIKDTENSSVSSSGKFFIPSVTSKNKENAGVNVSGVVGAGAVLAATSMAIGGKIYHDKKRETKDSDSDDNTDLDDNTVKNDDKFDFGTSKVDFKKNLSKDSNL